MLPKTRNGHRCRARFSSSVLMLKSGRSGSIARIFAQAAIALATSALPSFVKWGPPPTNAAQLGASILGPTNTRPGNLAATPARAASNSWGIAMYSPAAGGAGQPWLRGPRTTVIRSMRFKPAYFDRNVPTALPTCASHSAWVAQQGGLQLNTVSTTRSGEAEPFAHGDCGC